MKCSNCGFEVSDSHLFCLNCGAKLEASPQQEAPAPLPDLEQPAFAQSVPEQPAFAQPPVAEAAPEPSPIPQPAQAVDSQPIPAAAVPPVFTPGNSGESSQSFRDPFGPPPGEPKAEAQSQTFVYASPEGEVPPARRPFFDDNLAPIVKTSSWFGTMALWRALPVVILLLGSLCPAFIPLSTELATIIPLAAAVFALLYELIFPFVMAFNKRVNPSKQNFFRAYLLWILIFVILYIVLAVVLIFVGIEMFDSLGTDMLYNLPYDL